MAGLLPQTASKQTTTDFGNLAAFLPSFKIAGSTKAVPDATTGSTLGFIKSAAQAIPRDAASIGVTVGGLLDKSKVGATIDPTKMGPLGTALLGKEPIGGLAPTAASYESKLGGPGPISTPLAVLGATVPIGLDFLGLGGESGAIKALKGAKDVSEAAGILTKIGVHPDLVLPYAKIFAETTDESVIKNGLKSLTDLQKTTRVAGKGLLEEASGRQATPLSEKTAPSAGEALPPSAVSTPPVAPAPLPLPKLDSFLKDSMSLTNPQMNVENFLISDEGKAVISRVVDEIRPKIEAEIGVKLSNEETLNLASRSSKVLSRTIGRDETLGWQASMIKARQQLAAASQDGKVDGDYIKNLLTIKTQGTDIARKLQSLSIGAEAKEATAKQAILEAVLQTNADIEEITKAAEGVDFNDLRQATDFYRKFVEPKATEWLDLLRYNSMLSSPKTHIINAFSNLVNTTLVAPIEKALVGGLDFLGSKITGRARTAFAGEAGAYLKNYFANLKDAGLRFGAVMKGSRAYTNLDTKMIPIAASGKKGALVKALAYPLRLLEASDQFFTSLAEGGAKGALEYRAGKGVPVGNVEVRSKIEAAYRLFRQGLFEEGQGPVLDAIDRMTSVVSQLRNNTNPIISTISKFTVPFLQTPMNIFKQGVEYSPLGFSTAIGAGNKTEQIAKALVGSSVFGGAALMLMSNRLTFGEPIDPNLKAAFRAAGMQPYSVKIGDKWVSYQKLPPGIAFPLAMVAAIHDTKQNAKIDDNTIDQVLTSIAKYGQFLGDQSYARSIGDLLSAAKGGESGIEKLVSNYPQQIIPYRALGGWLARLTDEAQRKVDSSASFIDQQVQLLMLNIPGLSKKVPARTDANGDVIPNQNRVFNAISPVQVTNETGKAPAYKNILDIKAINQETSATSKALTDKAVSEYHKIKAMGTSDEKKAYLLGISKTDPELAKKIITVATSDKTGLSADEQKLSASSVATRAQYIKQQLDNLSTPEEKKALLKDYAQKKIVTAAVLQLLTQLQ